MATIIPPRRREDWFEDDGRFTIRAFKFFESLTESTNDTTTIINNATEETNGALSAKLATLQMRIGSGVPLTIDTTGFTIDTTLQFTDQTEV